MVVDPRTAMVHMQEPVGPAGLTTAAVAFENSGTMAAKAPARARELGRTGAAHPQPCFERPAAGTEERALKAAPPGRHSLRRSSRAGTRRDRRSSHESHIVAERIGTDNASKWEIVEAVKKELRVNGQITDEENSSGLCGEGFDSG